MLILIWNILVWNNFDGNKKGKHLLKVDQDSHSQTSRVSSGARWDGDAHSAMKEQNWGRTFFHVIRQLQTPISQLQGRKCVTFQRRFVPKFPCLGGRSSVPPPLGPHPHSCSSSSHDTQQHRGYLFIICDALDDWPSFINIRQLPVFCSLVHFCHFLHFFATVFSKYWLHRHTVNFSPCKTKKPNRDCSLDSNDKWLMVASLEDACTVFFFLLQQFNVSALQKVQQTLMRVPVCVRVPGRRVPQRRAGSRSLESDTARTRTVKVVRTVLGSGWQDKD